MARGTSVQPAMNRGAEARYAAALSAGRFLLQRCNDCTAHVFYPRELCPNCHGASLAWVETRGTGSVYSVTTVRRKPEAGGDYNVSLVELDEGVRLLSCVEGIPPPEVRIGLRVTARIADHHGGKRVVFDPAERAK